MSKLKVNTFNILNNLLARISNHFDDLTKSIYLTLPDLACPDLTWPDLTCPDLSWPDLTCPDQTGPNVNWPDLTYSILT